jgi:hypothetical protein
VEDTPSSRGLQWFTRKPLGYSVEPQNRGRRLDKEVRPPRPVQPPRRGGQTAWGRSDCPGWSNRPGGRSDRPGRRRREASKRRTRVEIARLASRQSRSRSPGIRPMKIFRRFPNPPLRAMYPYLLVKDSLVFWVPPYILIEWVDGSEHLEP